MEKLHPFIERWLRVRDHLSEDLLGGPRPWKLAWVINLQKGGTLFFVLALMAACDVWTTTAWLYAALHGSYGIVWLLKDKLFPDANWQRRVTLGGAGMAWLFVLGPYWIAPTLIVWQRLEATAATLALATLVYVVGVVVMIGADAQKFFVLRARPGLITDGFFGRVRHPNYLGEMMVYGSFAVVAGHPVPWIVLAVVWTLVFVPNILRKEVRMARHADWAAYRARTGLLLPRLGKQ
jgi:protein-S-isoprenylcysteine O-methyltransferase Ste14